MDIFLHSLTFSAATQWVLMHGYWVIFLAMLIEGPVVTAAAAFAVALGYFNLWAIFGLSLAGDLVADIIYYAIGYWGRITVVERFQPVRFRIDGVAVFVFTVALSKPERRQLHSLVGNMEIEWREV